MVNQVGPLRQSSSCITYTIKDQRMNNEFAGGKVDPVEAGRKGGQSSGGSSDGSDDSSGSTGGDYKPTDHGGLRKDGEPDGRVKGN